MDDCPLCGEALPYIPVLRVCLFHRDIAIVCPSCSAALKSRAPLAGLQLVWICVGALLMFRGMSPLAVDSATVVSAALLFWMGSFWIATPWLCRFRAVEPGIGGEAERRSCAHGP